MRRFLVVDFYDCVDVICRTDDPFVANEARDERYDATDDEADVYIYDLENETDYDIAKAYGLIED